MAFTSAELDNIANAAIDFHLAKGTVFSSTIQEKPLLNKFRKAQKTFAGGKGNITVRVKGTYTTTIQGYTHDDTVTYANPANIKTASYPWKEIHSGIEVTHTELKNDGITVTDDAEGKTSNKSGREATMLANLLEDKLEDMTEGTNRGVNLMWWRDGTADAKLVAGLKSIIVDDPTVATTIGGIDQSVETWWQNRSLVDNSGGAGTDDRIVANNGNKADQVLINTLNQEYRQLVRYGGRPDLWLAGSDFLDQLEREMREKGVYTQSGWGNIGNIELKMTDSQMNGMGIWYDPTLDDEGESKRCYAIDTKNICPMVMMGEDLRRRSPVRPYDKYAIYRAFTWTGALIAKQRNSSGVYEVA